jgi:hypothetical protein
MPMTSYNMRNPSKLGYGDYMRLEVRRRSLWERLRGAWWILFCEWGERE